MKRAVAAVVLALTAATWAAPAALADPDKDESGHGRHGYEYKEEYRDGNCKVERKWEKSGEYKEEVKCKGGRPPVVVYHAPSPAYIEPGSALSDIFVPHGGNILACNRDLVGSILGGAAGGLAGSQIGKGDGKLVATAAGTLLGVLIGGEIGRGMDRIDQACAGQVLEQTPANQVVRWRNPDDAAYEMTPIRSYQDTTGRPCREFTSTATVAGRGQQIYGTACRQPDGSWQIVG